MIVSIHQPQYLPWLPYFVKLEESELFIILDSVEFQKNGLQNRNKIKTAQGGAWLTVPVKQKLGQKIREVKIDNGTNWRRKHWLAISQNYGKSAAFRNYADELLAAYNQEHDQLVELNICFIKMMMRWMDIRTRLLRSSEMRASGKGSELVQSLCQEVGATRYISGSGGHDYLDEAAFQSVAIQVDYRPPVFPNPYPQQHSRVGFLNDLSALDVILNCGADWRNVIAGTS
jgi:hypothetical protein